MQRGSFRDAAAALRASAARLRVAPFEAARATAPSLARSVRSVIGSAPPLAPLADTTQAERVAAGFSADEPLLRSGELRDSWEAAVVDGENGPIAGVGTADPVAADHELGYYNARTGREVPPRAAGYEGFMAALPAAGEIWSAAVRRAIENE